MTDAIISIRPKHVEDIISGKKTVEVRLKNIKLLPGSRLWVYTTLPVGKVKVSAEIDFIESLPPDEGWRKYRECISISKKEYDAYTGGRSVVVVIGLRNVKILEKEICLSTMRQYEKDFQPPQFFTKLSPERALYSAFYT
tara:strand:+ start:7604 stop:8023 length:420 start_codon:yes stop_codon:yes gene_type:complete